MTQRSLILVHEPEEACRVRLAATGVASVHALEVSSYLAQSTDIAADLADIDAACAARGIAFHAVALDDFAGLIARGDMRGLAWTLTDGIAYFRGGAAPALARLAGWPTIGSDDSAFALCQDKFRAGAVMAAIGLPVPAAGLARDGHFLVEPPQSRQGWFVKPNRLGAKIGIWPDSRTSSLDEALDLSRRIFLAYGDDALVQAYVPGRNVRASWLDLDGSGDLSTLDAWFVDSGGDFQTMQDSMALYGDTGLEAAAAGLRSEPSLEPVDAALAAAIRAMAGRLVAVAGLRDVFSMDLRVVEGGPVHILEFEVCPGLPCFDFRAYCRARYGMSLAEAMAAAAAVRLA